MKYDVDVYREGRWWMIEVPVLDALTQARRVEEIEAQAVSLISTVLDVAPSEVEVSIHSLKIGDVDALAIADHVRQARADALAAEERSAKATAEAAKALSALAPVRDVGEMLGVSHQRVSQLVR